MDQQMLSNLLTDSLERAARRDREIFVQDTIDRFKIKKLKETEQLKSEEGRKIQLKIDNWELLKTLF
jgi:uncharacterized protein YaaW (UPF0174 family)